MEAVFNARAGPLQGQTTPGQETGGSDTDISTSPADEATGEGGRDTTGEGQRQGQTPGQPASVTVTPTTAGAGTMPCH